MRIISLRSSQLRTTGKKEKNTVADMHQCDAQRCNPRIGGETHSSKHVNAFLVRTQTKKAWLSVLSIEGSRCAACPPVCWWACWVNDDDESNATDQVPLHVYANWEHKGAHAEKPLESVRRTGQVGDFKFQTIEPLKASELVMTTVWP